MTQSPPKEQRDSREPSARFRKPYGKANSTATFRPQKRKLMVPERGRLALPGRQRGVALAEWVIVGPTALLITLLSIQSGLLMVGKSAVNYALFEAARIGSMQHANLTDIERGFIDAMAPYYGGGTNWAEVQAARGKALAEIAKSGTQIQILNPTQEAFADFKEVRNGQVQIPNDNLDRHSFRDPAHIGATSGQNIQDVNLLKLRVTYGFKPQVPLAGDLLGLGLKFFDEMTKADPAHAAFYAAGRIPLVSEVTLRMQSPAYQQKTLVSKPGLGDGGSADGNDGGNTGDTGGKDGTGGDNTGGKDDPTKDKPPCF